MFVAAHSLVTAIAELCFGFESHCCDTRLDYCSQREFLSASIILVARNSRFRLFCVIQGHQDEVVESVFVLSVHGKRTSVVAKGCSQHNLQCWRCILSCAIRDPKSCENIFKIDNVADVVCGVA